MLIIAFISFSLISLIILCKFYLLKRKRSHLNNYLNANYFIETLNNTINKNKYNLVEERIRLKKIDAYGNEDLKKWIGNPPLDQYAIDEDFRKGSINFKEGIPYFWEKVILKEFESKKLFFDKWRSYCKINPYINDEILGAKRKLNQEDWYVFLASQIEKSCIDVLENNYKPTKQQNYKKGIEFETHIKQILKHLGWKVKETPTSGDQGVDLIASIDDLRICIQCKDHKNAVGNKAVQEISAGRLYWKGTHAILISNSGFTKSAYKLAKENKVKLINEYELINLGNIVLK